MQWECKTNYKKKQLNLENRSSLLKSKIMSYKNIETSYQMRLNFFKNKSYKILKKKQLI